ncbi:hypothetical protein ACFVT1_17010 [Streptomyces sp. NPDC057963]|uniref:hypothetical protein n=1 Tax=Streptomyces sp. NPDC057963 TaxID=3346290 RepID=UPI0036E75947
MRKPPANRAPGHGFTAACTERTPYLRDLLGFSAVTTMYRPVTVADGREER